MTDLRKAAELALDALELGGLIKKTQSIAALRQALAQGEQGCAECRVKASDGYALYCVKCTELFIQPEHRFDTPESHIVKWSIPVDPNNFGEPLAQPEPWDTSDMAHRPNGLSIEQEPVAYLCENAVGHKYFRWKKPTSHYKPIALYTAPPSKPENPLDIADRAYFAGKQDGIEETIALTRSNNK